MGDRGEEGGRVGEKNNIGASQLRRATREMRGLIDRDRESGRAGMRCVLRCVLVCVCVCSAQKAQHAVMRFMIPLKTHQ